MTSATMATPATEIERPPVTRALAAFASGLRYQDLPAPTVEMAKRLLLDGIGCLLAGTQAADGRNATAMVRRLGASAQATLFTDLERASVRDADRKSVV